MSLIRKPDKEKNVFWWMEPVLTQQDLQETSRLIRMWPYMEMTHITIAAEVSMSSGSLIIRAAAGGTSGTRRHSRMIMM